MAKNVNFTGTDRTQRINAAASAKGEAYEKRCRLNPPESELSNGRDANKRNIIISPNEASSGEDFCNSYWFAALVVVLFLVAVWWA